MTAHIHRDCIVALAEDTSRKLYYFYQPTNTWVRVSAAQATLNWHPGTRYRVLDAGFNVIAETPAPGPRRVRIPETTLPAPLESLDGYEHVWTLGTYCTHTLKRPVAYCSSTLIWATREEAQEWLDFLTADREVMGDE